MGRITKQAQAAKTKQLQKSQAISKAKALPYNVLNEEINFITQDKIDMLNLPAKHIMWIGAKDAGKTRPVITRALGLMLENSNNYCLALKKYKTNAATRLHTAIANIALEMRMKGYDVPLTKKGITNTYLLKDKYGDNQSIEYASLDDMDGIAGIEAPNLGKWAVVHVEEPVMSGDKIQPTKEEFWEVISILESSVNRSNRRYSELTGKPQEFPTYHFTMNAWDDHPIITEAEEKFPENVFLNGCMGVDDWEKLSIEEIDDQWDDIKDSLVNNTTAYSLDKTEGKAFVRMTVFANPSWSKSEMIYNPKLEATQEEQLELFWDRIKEAIIQKDYQRLALFLGLKKQSDNSNKTYQMSLLQTGDTIKEIKEGGWKVIGTSQGWDVDINRLFVDTPVVLATRHTLEFGEEMKLFVLPQVGFPASGAGGGRNIPLYGKKMKEITYEQTGLLSSLSEFAKASANGDYLFIDDNQGVWLSNFLNDVFHIKGKAKKHGEWTIVKRQMWLNQAINAGFIMIDEKNAALINDMKASTLRDGNDQRDESSVLNKLYDRLNSLEYAVYPFHHWLHEFIRSN